MTLRRLCTLILGLPAEASIWAIARAEYEKSLKPTADKLRERQAHYDRKKAERGDA